MGSKMRMLETGKKFNTYIYVGVVIASLLILALILKETTDFVFVSNDDIFLQAILSGSLTGEPDAHAIYILYPLAWTIALFYRLLPEVNWYGIFILGIHFMCWGIILTKMISIATTKWKQVRNFFATYFFLIFLDLQWLIFSQYTALASIIACTALICIITVKNQNRIKEYILPIVLLVISLMLRSSAALMCLVFVLIFMFFKLVHCFFDKKDKVATQKLIKVYVKLLSILLVCFALSFLINKLAYQSDEWKYYDEYNNYRTEVYDYYLYPAYEGNEEFYQSIGIQEEEMYIIQSANLDLDSNITSQTMKAIYEKSKELKENNLQFTNVPRRLIFDYLDSFDEMNRELLSVYLLYGALLYVSIRKKQNSYVIGLILTFLARSGMRSYLIFMERLPDRVSSPLAFIEFVTLLGILLTILQNEKQNNKNEEIREIGYIVGSTIIVLFMILLMADVYKENLDRSILVKNEVAWSENIFHAIEADDKNTYLLDVYSVAPMKAPIFGGGDFPGNAIILGGWLQESPLLEQQYKNRFDVIINENILLQDNVYFVQRADLTTDWLVNYFESIDYPIQIEMVKSIDRNEEVLFNVYQLVR